MSEPSIESDLWRVRRFGHQPGNRGRCKPREQAVKEVSEHLSIIAAAEAAREIGRKVEQGEESILDADARIALLAEWLVGVRDA